MSGDGCIVPAAKRPKTPTNYLRSGDFVPITNFIKLNGQIFRDLSGPEQGRQTRPALKTLCSIVILTKSFGIMPGCTAGNGARFCGHGSRLPDARDGHNPIF